MRVRGFWRAGGAAAGRGQRQAGGNCVSGGRRSTGLTPIPTWRSFPHQPPGGLTIQLNSNIIDLDIASEPQVKVSVPQDCPTSDPNSSPGCHLCFYPTLYRREVPRTRPP